MSPDNKNYRVFFYTLCFWKLRAKFYAQSYKLYIYFYIFAFTTLYDF